MSKVAIIFPGIGYSEQKPLLHYTMKIAKENGYSIVCLDYADIFPNRKYDEKYLDKAYERCLEQLENQSIDEYDEVLLIAKSVGTILAGRYGKEGISNQRKKLLIMTPLALTFPYLKEENVIAFSGTVDPFIKEEDLRALAKEYEINMKIYANANHSLEVDRFPAQSVEILLDLVRSVIPWIKEG